MEPVSACARAVQGRSSVTATHAHVAPCSAMSVVLAMIEGPRLAARAPACYDLAVIAGELAGRVE